MVVLKCYVFGANVNPITGDKTAEQITVSIPAETGNEAQDKLFWMVGGLGRIGWFELIDVKPY